MNARINLPNIGNQLAIEIDCEVAGAVEKHGQFASLHEAYAVMLEEFDEVWDIVRKKRLARCPDHLRTELIQIAACTIKAIHSIENFTGEGKR